MTTSVHWRTPSLAVTGPRGDAIRTVEYLRKVAGGAVQALVTRQQHDVAGQPVAQYDPRLAIPNTVTVFALNGQPLKTTNVDAGVNVSLPGLAGEPLQTWDANGNHRRMIHDPQLRLVRLEENSAADIETFTYAPAAADPGQNLRGQLTRLTDASGSVEYKSYALTGQPLSETRTFTDAITYTSQQVTSPLGAVLESIDAGGHKQQSTYDVAGQLIQVQLQIKGQAWQPILKGMRYNAEGKVIEQQSANDVTSSWVYDKADGQLRRHYAQRASGQALKDDEYSNDRMGNITHIRDHTYTSTYFRNQRVDGDREFEYDSLSRLIRATGHDDAPPKDNQGLPQPTDPNDRRNYVQTYDMDEGGNLTCLTHVRDENTYHYRMFVDPRSNRAVRWKDGDPVPDIDTEFDSAGNLKALQRGQPIQWNSRNQVQSVTLVEHASGPPDTERYQYSQGVRVHKRLETHSRTVSHFVDVRYLQNLQIRSKDDGELLHHITIPTGVGHVTCLHWVNKKPDGITNNQLRYALADNLGSTVMELDVSAKLISKETYSPYGATTTLAASSQIEVDYKFIRYSNQETDISGLIDYGARNYAPWLCRWISADPRGDVDGSNRYAFVGNNPMSYFDDGGTQRKPSEQRRIISNQINYLSTAQKNLDEVNQQFVDLTSPTTFRLKVVKNLFYLAGRATVGFFSALATTGDAFSNSTVPGELQGLSLGNFTADRTVGTYEKKLSPLQMNSAILPRHANLEPGSIRNQSSGTSAGPLDRLTVNPGTWQERSENIRALFSVARDSGGGAILPGVSELFELLHVAKDATKAEEQLTAFELDAYDALLDNLEQSIIKAADIADATFEEMGVGQFYASNLDYFADIGLGKVGASDSRAVSRSDIAKYREKALQSLHETRTTVKRYRQYADIKIAPSRPRSGVVSWWNNGGR